MRLLEAVPQGHLRLTAPVCAATVGTLRERVRDAVRAAGVLGRVGWEVFEYRVGIEDVLELRQSGKWSPDLVSSWAVLTDGDKWRRL